MYSVCNVPRRCPRTALLTILVAGVLALGSSRPVDAGAAVPPASSGTAVVNVFVGGDRATPTTIAPRPGVTFGLFATEPSEYDPFDGYTTAAPLYSCVADADGDCAFQVPVGRGGVREGTRLWVAPIAGPLGTGANWFANPVWQTAPLTGGSRDQTRHVFQTPRLFGNNVYLPGSGGYISDPGAQTDPPNRTSDYTRRIASGGAWPMSRADPRLPAQCGLNVGLVVDLSSSMNGSVPALKGAMDAFVGALRGTPSRAALYTFSTDTPAVAIAAAGGGNTSLLPVATTADAAKFAALYAGWTNGTANGYTNWDRALAQVAEDNSKQPDEGFDLVVFLTDGNPTVYGPITGGIPARSGYTRFREIGNAVASANLLKRSGGTIRNDVLVGGTRILAVGVGGGLDAGAGRNLRAISGRTEYDGTNLPEADYFRTTDFETVGRRLREVLLAECAPSVSVVKQIVPFGGTIDDAVTPGEPWDFRAETTTSGATVSPESASTDPITGALNFELAFDSEAAPAGLDVRENPRTADGYRPFRVGGDNAVCVNKSEDDRPVPVTNIGTTGFNVDVGLQDAVSCVVYNEAPDLTSASVVADKQWRVTSAAGTETYAEGQQPAGLDGRLSLTGPGSADPTEQPWRVVRSGYAAGDVVTLSESLDIGMPGCTFTGGTVTGPGITGGTLTPGDRSAQATLPAGANAYTITNDIRCTSRLTLRKQVRGGDAPPNAWTLQGLSPSGALPGPLGLSGVTAEVTEGVDYQLAEQLNNGDPSLLNYRQADYRQRPLANPQSTGSMACEVVDDGALRRGNSLGQEGAVAVPLGQDMTCVATNQTAPLTLVKRIVGGNAAPSEFRFTLTPVSPDPGGLSTQTAAGSGRPGTTVHVRPDQQYRVTETGRSDYRLTDLTCAVGSTTQSGELLTIPAGANATCTATNTFTPSGGPPTPSPVLPHYRPPSNRSRPRLSVTKTPNRKTARRGQRIVFRIVVGSRGPTVARSVRVCDRLSGSLLLVRARGAQLRKGGRICWTVPRLAPGERRVFTVVAAVPRRQATRSVRNLVRVTGSNFNSVRATARVRLVGSPPRVPRFTG